MTLAAKSPARARREKDFIFVGYVIRFGFLKEGEELEGTRNVADDSKVG